MPATYRKASRVGHVTRIEFAWTSNASGAATMALTENVNGALMQVQFVPGSGGSQPTNEYDATLTDENGQDVLAGLGANLSNANKTRVTPGVLASDGTNNSVVPFVLCEPLTLTIANAGDTKTGKVILYVR